MAAAPRRGAGGERRDRRGGAADKGVSYTEKVVTINRVAKVVKGGRRFSFTALVVVGDGDGMVGVGYGKAREVPLAISKGVEEAKKNFFRVPRVAKTVPHPVQGEDAAGVVLLRPAAALDWIQLRSSKLAPQLRQLTVIFPLPRGTRRYCPQLGHLK